MSSEQGIRELALELLDLEGIRREKKLSEQELQRFHQLVELILASLQKQAKNERRKHLRIPADLVVRFCINEASITCNAYELSLGGIGLRGNVWVKENQELIIENLRLGRRDYPMSVRAKIVWKNSEETKPLGAGLIFLNLNDEGKRQIRSVFEELFFSFIYKLVEEKK
jgi:hypothetical protein